MAGNQGDGTPTAPAEGIEGVLVADGGISIDLEVDNIEVGVAWGVGTTVEHRSSVPVARFG
jgi:hypothetical protein